MKTEYQHFSHQGEQYRALLENGMLKAICHRRSPLHPWRKMSDEKAKELLKGVKTNEQPKLRACV
jgi:hypothetical protein